MILIIIIMTIVFINYNCTTNAGDNNDHIIILINTVVMIVMIGISLINKTSISVAIRCWIPTFQSLR